MTNGIRAFIICVHNSMEFLLQKRSFQVKIKDFSYLAHYATEKTVLTVFTQEAVSAIKRIF